MKKIIWEIVLLSLTSFVSLFFFVLLFQSPLMVEIGRLLSQVETWRLWCLATASTICLLCVVSIAEVFGRIWEQFTEPFLKSWFRQMKDLLYF